MSEEELKATSMDKDKASGGEGDVDALIAGALKELGSQPEGKKEPSEKVLKATPISKPAPKPAQKTGPQEAQKAPLGKVPAEKQAESASPYEVTFKEYEVGQLIKGTIEKIDASGALLNIGYKSDGFLAPEELAQGMQAGDKVDVVIEKLESKEGYVILSHKRAAAEAKWNEAFQAYKNKTLLEAKVTSAVKGGLVVDYHGIRGFIPASQVKKDPEVQLESFVKKTLPVKIIELNRRQGKIILSHKFGVTAKQKEEAQKMIEDVEVGQVRHGKVVSIKNFGAFVDIGGVEGLIHLSELSWKRVKHPSDILKLGQELDVFVLGVDKVNKKVALGLKELQPDPWVEAPKKYKSGQILKVKIARLVKFGAFADIDESLEGLIHISELSTSRIQKPEDAVKPGDEVEVKILRILPEEQKIGLSIKEAILEKERQAAEEKRKEESKITIGEVIAEKERLREDVEEEAE
jgi:ribosomal protein S1